MKTPMNISRRSFLAGAALGAGFVAVGAAGYFIGARSPLSGADQVLNGQRQSSGGRMPGVDGEYLHYQFRNPEDSGKIALLYEVDIAPDQSVDVELRSLNDKVGESFPTCNLMFAAGRATMEMNGFHAPEELGNFHSVFFAEGGKRTLLEMGDVPLVGLEPGRGVVIALRTPGIGAVCNLQWREISA